jgi:hypothetical protein
MALILAVAVPLSLGPQPAQAEAEPASGPRIAASAICLGVEDHEPVAPADSFAVDVERLYCWTRVEDGAGESVVHAWIHEGTTRARVELSVGSPSWRTYSTKGLLPGWTGKWEVKVMTTDGVVLETIPFVVTRGEP